ncbi:MAG TPA: hypothetical protein VF097_07810 [Actinomycetota bacterium]
MELFLLALTAAVVGWLLWQLTEGSRDHRWTGMTEPPAPDADAGLRSLPSTPDERTHPLVAATLLVFSILIVALGVAAGVYFAGRFVIERLGQMLGL